MTDLTSPEVTDAERLSRYRGGDLESFEVLYDRYAPALLLYARSLTRDPAVSEDIVQETFVRLLEYDPARLQGSAKAFLFAIARNLATDERRKAAVDLRARLSLPLRHRGTPAGPDADPQQVSRLLYELPEEQREALLLKVFGDMTFAQVAKITGVPAPTVMSRYRYALLKLGQLLSGK